MTYANRQIDDLCVSRFTIWNSGNKTLNASDMVTSKELTICAGEESQILDAELIACSEETNKFSVQIVDEHTVKIPFDYVDRREGLVVQVLHTGTDETLKIACKIKGGLPMRNFINETIPRIIFKITSRLMTSKASSFAYIVMLLLLLGFALYETLLAFGVDLHATRVESTIETTLSASTDVSEAAETTLSAPKDMGENMHKHLLSSIILWLYFLFYFLLSLPVLKMRLKIGVPNVLRKHSSFDN